MYFAVRSIVARPHVSGSSLSRRRTPGVRRVVVSAKPRVPGCLGYRYTTAWDERASSVWVTMTSAASAGEGEGGDGDPSTGVSASASAKVRGEREREGEREIETTLVYDCIYRTVSRQGWYLGKVSVVVFRAVTVFAVVLALPEVPQIKCRA